MKIPRCMSTQHPDNVRAPFFSDSSILQGDDEIKEAFYAYSHLKCNEQLWDCEGKEADSFVVKKLLTKYDGYFSRHRIGKDIFLTLRVPNPEIEKNEAKILLETLEGIPRAYDAAKTFYNQFSQGEDIAPIFEVAVPMVEHAKAVSRVSSYYSNFVVGKANKMILKNDITIEKWIGQFKPDKLRVIPLVETKDAMLNSDKIVAEHLKTEKVKDYQRVWLARSDPALNYGNIAAVLTEKVALQRLHALETKESVDIYPILGCGSAPFRGNLKPTNVDNCMRGYPSVQTFTLQSAFKYDYDERQVMEAIDVLNTTTRKRPTEVDEERCKTIINKISDSYARDVKLIAPMVNQMATYVPNRRKRKLHVGLFGYARDSKGVSLPRAIKFCGALYAYGLPPELLGMSTLTSKDLDYIKTAYPGFMTDYKDALHYLNKENIKLLPQPLQKSYNASLKIVADSGLAVDPSEAHAKVTSIIVKDLKTNNHALLTENIERAGWLRGFLG